MGDERFLLRDRSNQIEVVRPDVMTVNVHNTYLPGNEWILNRTYPDKDRLQHRYLYRVATGRRVPPHLCSALRALQRLVDGDLLLC